jgi:hypothetical protein
MRFTCLILAIGGAFLSGCASETNISGNQAYPTDFKTGAIYRTRVPLIACLQHGPFETFIRAERTTDPSDVPVGSFPTGGGNYETYELLPTNSQIRITKVTRFWALFDVPSSMIIGAKMETEPHRGMEVVLDPICKTAASPTIDKGLLVRDRTVLEEIRSE